MDSYLAPWKKYATFSGRATRGEYWTFVLINVVIAGVLVGIAVGTKTTALYALYGAFALAILIPSLAVLVRRLHDTDRSGGWFFIAFVPLIGSIWLLVLMLTGGTPGPNKYGAPA